MLKTNNLHFIHLQVLPLLEPLSIGKWETASKTVGNNWELCFHCVYFINTTNNVWHAFQQNVMHKVLWLTSNHRRKLKFK